MVFDEPGLRKVAERLERIFAAMDWRWQGVPPDADAIEAELLARQVRMVKENLVSIESGRITTLRDTWGDASGEWMTVLIEVGDADRDSVEEREA